MPKKSRKARTFEGDTICEITSPRPKMKPQARLAECRHGFQPPNTCRVSATTVTAVVMNIVVAAIERGDSRAMPQMPWPDVPAVAKPGAEADEETGRDSDGARRQLRRRHRMAGKARGKRRRDEAGDEGQPPAPIVAVRIEKPAHDSADAGDAAGEQASTRRRQARSARRRSPPRSE